MSTPRFLIIGAGGNARGHGKRLRQHGAEIVGIADPSPASRERFARELELSVPQATEHRPLLQDLRPDAVLISSPHTCHATQVLDALAANCHVLAEKPLACSLAEVDAILAARSAAGRHVFVSYQRRLGARFRWLKQQLHGPSTGRLLAVQALQTQNWLRSQRGTWRHDPALSGGGQMHDSGSHLIDILLWLLADPVVEVAATCDQRGTAVDIDSMIRFTTRGGCVGTLAIIGSSAACGMWEDITISGEHVSWYLRRGGSLHRGDAQGFTAIEDLDGLADQDPDAHFLEVISGRAANASPPEDFRQVIAVTEACWRSAANGGRPERVAT